MGHAWSCEINDKMIEMLQTYRHAYIANAPIQQQGRQVWRCLPWCSSCASAHCCCDPCIFMHFVCTVACLGCNELLHKQIQQGSDLAAAFANEVACLCVTASQIHLIGFQWPCDGVVCKPQSCHLPSRQTIRVGETFDLGLRSPRKNQAVRETHSHTCMAALLYMAPVTMGCRPCDGCSGKLLPATDSAMQELTRVL